MMGHRERLKGGDEYDALTKTGRRYLRFRPGEAKAAKARFARRTRRAAKQQAREEV